MYNNFYLYNEELSFKVTNTGHKMLKQLLDFFETKKKQQNCKHEDITIVSKISPYYTIHCYDCNKTWNEKEK